MRSPPGVDEENPILLILPPARLILPPALLGVRVAPFSITVLLTVLLGCGNMLDLLPAIDVDDLVLGSLLDGLSATEGSPTGVALPSESILESSPREE
jgi:hypothetical protein